MDKYIHTKEYYVVDRMTVSALVKKFCASHIYGYFIEYEGETPASIESNFSYIQSLPANKKLTILSLLEDEHCKIIRYRSQDTSQLELNLPQHL